MKIRLLFSCLFLIGILPSTFGQLFRLEAGVGTSYFSWHEEQMSADLNVQLTIQKKNSNHIFFVALKALGNTVHSEVDRANYTFIEPNNKYTNPLGKSEPLYSAYRGGEAEVGFSWNQKPHQHTFFYPILSLYSKTIARRINTDKTKYAEEEKQSLHGIKAGVGIMVPGKSNFNLQLQVFEPVLRSVTLFGAYVGIPFETSSTANDLSFKGKMSIRKNKFNFNLSYEILQLGSAENKNSKPIFASTVNTISTSVNYEF